MIKEIIYKHEVYTIVGLCMNVYNSLGFGFLEIVYKDAIQLELEEMAIAFIREKEFPVVYKGKKLKRTFYADFLVFDKIIIEVKANAEGISSEAVAQTINYLKASGNKLGLIINFGKRKLDYMRVVF